MKTKSKNIYALLFITMAVIVALLILFINLKRNNNNTSISNSTKAFLSKIDKDKMIELDLDGDGKNEKIEYKIGKLLINNKEFTNFKSDMRMLGPIYDYFTIVDFLEEDNLYEIGISTYGRSDDLETYFYHYKDNNLNFIGSLEGEPYGDTLRIETNGDGTINAPLRLSVLQTWWGYQKYSFENNTFIQEPQEFYEPCSKDKVIIKDGLILYTEADLSSLPYNPSSNEGVLTKTDNKDWCQITFDNGDIAWFYLEENMEKYFEELRIYD